VFKATVMRPGATAVPGIGKIAYSALLPALGGEAGPAVEVGWLSGDGRLISLQYRFPAGTADADVAAFTPKLVELAKKIDQSSL
jgi:hypothetical protein